MAILLQDIIIEDNGYKTILYAGTIIKEAVYDLDAPEMDEKAEAQDEMINIVQKWIEQNRKRFTPEGWSKIVDILQPAIDAIYNKNTEKLKEYSIALSNKTEKIEGNKKAKYALEKIHDLYVKLLGMARGHFNESINEVINIIEESIKKLKTI
jgi:predicted XRE-type DNA-binding protein